MARHTWLRVAWACFCCCKRRGQHSLRAADAVRRAYRLAAALVKGAHGGVQLLDRQRHFEPRGRATSSGLAAGDFDRLLGGRSGSCLRDGAVVAGSTRGVRRRRGRGRSSACTGARESAGGATPDGSEVRAATMAGWPRGNSGWWVVAKQGYEASLLERVDDDFVERRRRW